MIIDDSMNYLYDTLTPDERDDKIALLFEVNNENLVAVNTPFGTTERKVVKKLVQQGGKFGPTLCSNTMDSVGKKGKEKHKYNYKKRVPIPIMSYIDDVNAAAKCGVASLEMNSFITAQIRTKRLKFNVGDNGKKSKCKKMHVGERKDEYNKTMKVENT